MVRQQRIRGPPDAVFDKNKPNKFTSESMAAEHGFPPGWSMTVYKYASSSLRRLRGPTGKWFATVKAAKEYLATLPEGGGGGCAAKKEPPRVAVKAEVGRVKVKAELAEPESAAVREFATPKRRLPQKASDATDPAAHKAKRVKSELLPAKLEETPLPRNQSPRFKKEEAAHGSVELGKQLQADADPDGSQQVWFQCTRHGCPAAHAVIYAGDKYRSQRKWKHINARAHLACKEGPASGNAPEDLEATPAAAAEVAPPQRIRRRTPPPPPAAPAVKQEAAAAGLRAAAPAVKEEVAAGLRAAAEELRAQLRLQGFGKDPELVGVTGGGSTRWLSELLRGIYVRCSVPVAGRPCYQKVRRRLTGASEVSLAPVYIFWSVQGAYWRVADRPQGQADTYARSPLDWRRPPLPELQGRWKVQDNGQWKEDAAMAVIALPEPPQG